MTQEQQFFHALRDVFVGAKISRGINLMRIKARHQSVLWHLDQVIQLSAAIFASRTGQSTPESGTRAGSDGAKRRCGSKLHLAVDTLGHLLPLHVATADAKTSSREVRWLSKSKMRPASEVHNTL